MRAQDDITFFEKVSNLLGEATRHCSFEKGEYVCVLDKSSFLRAITLIRDHKSCLFNQLIDLTVVDFPEREKRFHVVYHLLSMTYNKRIRLKVELKEKENISSIMSVFACANWYEREAFDMYGIVFEGHSDLRRILTDYNFDGYPLRKDFPLTGYVEVRYDDLLKRVVYEPVQLTQAYRSFDYVSPWEGMMDTSVRGNPTLPGDEKAKNSGGAA